MAPSLSLNFEPAAAIEFGGTQADSNLIEFPRTVEPVEPALISVPRIFEALETLEVSEAMAVLDVERVGETAETAPEIRDELLLGSLPAGFQYGEPPAEENESNQVAKELPLSADAATADVE